VIACASDPPVIVTYRTPLTLVLRNLISNALQHHDRDAGRIDVTMQRSGDSAQFRVSDDGPGIEKRFHDQIFQIFRTLQRRDVLESSGIGLAMVQKLVTENGGRIWVESAPPARGSVFAFTWTLTSGET
jgi:signal transduction histidine kinase